MWQSVRGVPMSQVFDFHGHSGSRPKRRAHRRIDPLILLLGLVFLATAATFVWREYTAIREPSFANLALHLAAFPNCETASMVGLTSAQRGEPGYWLRHDTDFDGIACEPQESAVFLQR